MLGIQFGFCVDRSLNKETKLSPFPFSQMHTNSYKVNKKRGEEGWKQLQKTYQEVWKQQNNNRKGDENNKTAWQKAQAKNIKTKQQERWEY